MTKRTNTTPSRPARIGPVQVTRAELRTVQVAAKARGITVAAFVRDACVMSAQRGAA